MLSKLFSPCPYLFSLSLSISLYLTKRFANDEKDPPEPEDHEVVLFISLSSSLDLYLLALYIVGDEKYKAEDKEVVLLIPHLISLSHFTLSLSIYLYLTKRFATEMAMRNAERRIRTLNPSLDISLSFLSVSLYLPVPDEEICHRDNDEEDPPEPEDHEVVLVEQVVGQQAEIALVLRGSVISYI